MINISKGGKRMARKQFATSIEEVTADNFRKSCDERGIKMNVVLEAFMAQFSSNEFSIEITKSGVKLKNEVR
jgi:hypothetical protein